MKNIFSPIAILVLFALNCFSQNPGDSIFNSSQIHTIKIFFTQPNWYDSLIAYKPLDKKMLGDVEIDGTYIDSVGIQFKGNSSFNAPGIKKPWKIDFNEFVSGKKYDGLKALNLNNAMKDPTFMREKLFDDFCSAAGIEAPRATYANVYVNNTLWGFYIAVEQVNKTLLTTQIGNDGGNLFKGDANGTLQWYGTNQSSYYGKYELKTNETPHDWSDLVHLIDEINNTPSNNFYDSLEVVLNTNAWIEAWAANNIFVNLDSYVGSGHNYYIYHNTSTDKFDFIIWDCNETFGNFNQGMNITQLENLTILYIPSPASSRPLSDKMLQNTTYQNNYVNTICNYVVNYFSHAYLDPRIDSLYNIIKPYVYADPNKPYTNQSFEDNINTDVMGNIPGLKSFITNRRSSLISQLATYGCNMGVEDTEYSGVNVEVYPNPFSESATLLILNSDGYRNQPAILNSQFLMYDVLGREVYSAPIRNSSSFVIRRGNLLSGMYFYEVKNGKEIIGKGKLLVQ